ncbi:hypothetical protein D3C75_1031630 [compost metagenome]
MIDAAVKEVQPDIRAAQQISANKLAGDFEQLVIHCDDMVAVPADRSADMQQQLLAEHQNGGQFIGNNFGRMEMSGIQADRLAPGQPVAHIEFMRSNHIAL